MSDPFRSFWMAGFECADHSNMFGDRVDLLAATGHPERAAEDFASLAPYEIATVREGICWSQVETRPHQYNWERVRALLAAGQAAGVQQVWDLCHFGFPADLTPLHPHLPSRFSALCDAFVQFYRSVVPSGPLIVTPMNEVSFLSWLGGEVRGTSPYTANQGWEVKQALMRAYIAGVTTLRARDPAIRIMTTEPLINIVPGFNDGPAARRRARVAHNAQFQVTDILSGRSSPELGGRPEFLDLVGWNFYFNNQWVHAPHATLGWRDAVMDPRWVPLHRLLQSAQRRYRRPIVLTETSHMGIDRPLWLRQVAEECALAIQARVPLYGVCWYPILDRPDWNHPQHWHHSGLWDRPDGAPHPYPRTLYEPLADEWPHATAMVAQARAARAPRRRAAALVS